MYARFNISFLAALLCIYSTFLQAQVVDYADTGNGLYQDDVLWMTWAGTDLADGIHDGDQVIYAMPNGGTLQLDFSNVSIAYPIPDPTPGDGETPDGYLPCDMMIWCGATLYTAYDLSSSSSEVLISDKSAAGVLGDGENGQDIAFDLTATATINGQVIPVDVILGDPETTNPSAGFQEQLRFTTNAGAWGLVEHINSSAYGLSGLGTMVTSITDTEMGVACSGGVNSGNNGSPLLLTKGVDGTTTTVRMEAIFPNGSGHQGFAIAVLMPVDQSDGPLSYGVASHIQKMEVPSGGGPGLENTSDLYLGSVRGDTDYYLNSAGLLTSALNGDDDDDLDDEDGFTLSGQELVTSLTGGILEIPAYSVPLSNQSGADATLHAWIDFDENLSFDNDEYASVNVGDGAIRPDGNLIFTLPLDYSIGDKSIRFRLSSDPGLDADSSFGIAVDGEVEDHIFTMVDICSAPSFQDIDGDGLNDVCDLDDDNDGISDADECALNPDITFSALLAGGTVTLNGVDITVTTTGTVNGFSSDGELVSGAHLNPGLFTAPSTSSITIGFSQPINAFSTTFEAQQDEEMITFSEPATSVENFLNSTYGNYPPIMSQATLENGGLELRSNLTDDPGTSAAAFGSNSRVNWIFSTPIASLTITHTGVDRGNAIGATNYNGTVLGGAFSVCTDTDGDGIPDYLDLDSDGDGCPDVLEAGFTDDDSDGILGDSPVTVDGDGLVTSGVDGYTGSNSYVLDSSLQSGCPDNDIDFISDLNDLDDDNDGIPDVDEGYYDSGYTSPLDATDVDFHLTGDPLDHYSQRVLDSLSIQGEVYSDFILPDNYRASFSTPTDPNRIRLVHFGVHTHTYDTSTDWDIEATLTFQSQDLNFYHNIDTDFLEGVDYYELSYDDPVLVARGMFIACSERHGNNGIWVESFNANSEVLGARYYVGASDYFDTGWNVATTTTSAALVYLCVLPLDLIASPGDEIGFLRIYPENSSGTPDGADGKVFIFGDSLIDSDLDGDGVRNSFDLDSDNDGIYDLIEAGHTAPDLDLDGVIDGSPVVFGINGLYDLIESSSDSGQLNYVIRDSDGDAEFNAYESDSDGDTCNDVIEAGFPDADGDGQLGGLVPPTVDTDGKVTSGGL